MRFCLEVLFIICCLLLFVYFLFYDHIQFYYLLKKHNKEYINDPDLQIFIPKKIKDFSKLYYDFRDFKESSSLLHYIYYLKYSDDDNNECK